LAGVWARGVSKKLGTPYVFLQPLKLATSNLVHNLGLGLAYQKQSLVPKLDGVWARGASINKFGIPYIFLQPLKLESSNFVHKLGLGLAYQKRRLGPKLAGIWAREASPPKKKLGPPTYFCNR